MVFFDSWGHPWKTSAGCAGFLVVQDGVLHEAVEAPEEGDWCENILGPVSNGFDTKADPAWVGYARARA